MKKIIEFIKELKKKPYGKSVLFFGFYLIFFIVIFIILGIGGSRNLNKNYENRSKVVNVNLLNTKKYSFSYEVNLDNSVNTYIGKKDERYEYKYNDKDYYQENLITYVKEDNWVSAESPIKFNKLLEAKYIDKVINSSYVEAKTTYDNGNTMYSLLISSNTLNKILDNKDTDIDDVANKITLTIDKHRYVNEIDYDLNNYCKSNNICNSNLNIKAKYYDYISVN